VARVRQSDPCPAEPIQRTVQEPSDPDDNARRDTGRPRTDGGHAAPASVATMGREGTAVAGPVGLADAAAAAIISGADDLKPLKVSQRPSPSSHTKIGIVATPGTREYCSKRCSDA